MGPPMPAKPLEVTALAKCGRDWNRTRNPCSAGRRPSAQNRDCGGNKGTYLYKGPHGALHTMYRVTHLLAGLGLGWLRFGMFHCLAWAAPQLQYSPTACGTSPNRNQPNPGPRGDGSPCTVIELSPHNFRTLPKKEIKKTDLYLYTSLENGDPASETPECIPHIFLVLLRL